MQQTRLRLKICHLGNIKDLSEAESVAPQQQQLRGCKGPIVTLKKYKVNKMDITRLPDFINFVVI